MPEGTAKTAGRKTRKAPELKAIHEDIIQAVCTVLELVPAQLRKREGRLDDRDQERRVGWGRGMCALLAGEQGIAVVRISRRLGYSQGERLRQLRTKHEGWLRQTKWIDPPAQSLSFAEDLKAVRIRFGLVSAVSG